MLQNILSTFTPYFQFDDCVVSKSANKILFSYLEKYPKILNTFKTSSDNFETSKYHQENLEEHFIACGIACQLYAEKFYNNVSNYVNISKEDFIKLSLLLGLFHDIGKPYSATKVSPKKTKVIYTGHSQLGARITEEFIDTLEIIKKYQVLCYGWAIMLANLFKIHKNNIINLNKNEILDLFCDYYANYNYEKPIYLNSCEKNNCNLHRFFIIINRSLYPFTTGILKTQFFLSFYF